MDAQSVAPGRMSPWICLSCGSAATTPYCGTCGERSLVDTEPIAGDDRMTGDLAVTGIEGAVLAWCLVIALGTVFGLSRLRRGLTAVVLIAALYAILKAYHVVVFATTLYST